MYRELDALIEENSQFCITTHVNPDGDSIGSEIALQRYLKIKGKSVQILNASATAPELQFLDPDKTIVTAAEGTPSPDFDIVLCVDTALISRFENIGSAVDLNNINIYPIDHHIPDDKSLAGLVDPEASSTGEILYHYFTHALGEPLQPQLAEPLFYAIAADTGWMQFANTNPDILRILAQLAETAGLNFQESYDKLKNNWPEERFRLFNEVMSTLEIIEGTAFIHCDQDMLLKYPHLIDISYATETFVEELKKLKDCDLLLLLKEKEDRSGFRVSMRSRKDINVQQLAFRFDGGGHIMASGCTVNIPSLDEAKKTLLKELKRLPDKE
jgi:phosphoesterase RecJ-like protein